ncbi:hypothetical protein [Bacillus rubiinfantis]|uniref:hypothetical protein n=1 Tax=Bacillus rubiinfantis TaxID=1499680 RepID=UPI000A3F0A11|nr:hypothetical protein [Bacillus rubiinfantis]
MLKLVLRGKYLYHVFLQRYNEVLQKDCLSEELRMKLKVKATYHSSKVVELGARK